jgi:hypothetical protein
MGLVIRLYDITGFSTNYNVELQTGATFNNTSWVKYKTGQTENTLSIEFVSGTTLLSGTSITSYFNNFNSVNSWPYQYPELTPNESNNLKFWIKITDNLTENYIIENIKVHEKEYYSDCLYCCSFDNNLTSQYISGF